VRIDILCKKICNDGKLAVRQHIRETSMETATVEEVQARERQWMQAWVDGDMAVCASMLADDFVLTSARGTPRHRAGARSRSACASC
jgi:ketosteroid isomerase-like protein